MDEAQTSPQQFWQERYGEADRIWSGRPNDALVEVCTALPAGAALDLGCGEGGDAVWLAQRGWRVTAVDVASNAIDRGARAAAAVGATDIQWVVQDLATWSSQDKYDLVTACFLQSPVRLPRTQVLRRAAGMVARNGHLLIVAHADFPPWATHRFDHRFLTAQQEVAELDLPAGEWDAVLAHSRTRRAVGPDGQEADVEDVVVLLHRA